MKSRWIPVSFVAAALLLFGPSVGGEWVLDGVSVVEKNPELASFDPVRIAKEDWWAGTGKPGGLYRPVALLWLGALHSMSEASPALVDFFNVLLHGLVAWARYALLVRFLGNGPRPWIVAWLAAMFALVHPTAVEVVAGQVGAADLLATLFMTTAIVAGDSTKPRRLVAAALLAALGALSKESAVAVVPVAVLFEALRERSDGRARRVVRAAIWSCAGVAVAVLCRIAAIGSLVSADDPVYAGFPTIARIASACAAFGTYVVPLLIAPWRQLAVVSLQDAWPVAGFADARALAGLAMILLLAAGPIVALRRGNRAVAFGCWTFLATWLPASNLVFSSGAVAASRFLYPGLIGLALVLAAGVAAGWARGGVPRIAAALAVAWFGVSMIVFTAIELPAWRSPRELYELQVARAPESSYSLVDLGLMIASDEPARAAVLLDAAATAPMPTIPGSQHPPEDLLESVFIARTGAARLAASHGDPAMARRRLSEAVTTAKRGADAMADLPYRENWKHHQGYAIRQIARLEIDDAKKLEGAARASALRQAEMRLQSGELFEAGTPESVELGAAILQLKGDAAGQRALVERAWRSNPADPLIRGLWTQELRKLGRMSEAVAIEVDIALERFDTIDHASALATAEQAVTDSDPAVRAKGRKVLSEIAGRSRDRALAVRAARALAAARQN